jgi:hypothetical protein
MENEQDAFGRHFRMQGADPARAAEEFLHCDQFLCVNRQSSELDIDEGWELRPSS